MPQSRHAAKPAAKSVGQASLRGAIAPQAYNGEVRSRIAELQRARIVRAAFDVAYERGAGGVTVAHLVQRAGVSRRTFYEQFSDTEDCLLAAFEQALAYARESVVPTYESARGWRERIRAALVALLAFLDEQPRIGRVLVYESFASGRRTLERRGEVVEQLTRLVDEGRTEAKGDTVAPLTAEGVVGGVLAVIQGRLAEPDHPSLVELVNPLMSTIVLPYLGAAAARREMTRPTPVPAPVPATEVQRDALNADPFKASGMRLTYRTVHVLVAIAEHPDASNRLIADTAGITDQGQISKLLSRLERNGLVENTYRHPGKGAPNSWSLTELGQQVTRGLNAHSDSNFHGAPHSDRATDLEHRGGEG